MKYNKVSVDAILVCTPATSISIHTAIIVFIMPTNHHSKCNLTRLVSKEIVIHFLASFFT